MTASRVKKLVFWGAILLVVAWFRTWLLDHYITGTGPKALLLVAFLALFVALEAIACTRIYSNPTTAKYIDLQAIPKSLWLLNAGFIGIMTFCTVAGKFHPGFGQIYWITNQFFFSPLILVLVVVSEEKAFSG